MDTGFRRYDEAAHQLKIGLILIDARDHPKLTGAHSAPYETLRVLRAFVVKTASQ